MDMISAYNTLAALPTFSIVDVEHLIKNRDSAYTLLSRLLEKGLVRKIRTQLYSAVNQITNKVSASNYQIACAASDSAYISHHTAFEYHGIARLILGDVYVSSDTRIQHFEFEGIRYRHVPFKFEDGVITANGIVGVRVTDLERTLIDGIHSFVRVGGLEELIRCIGNIPCLDEQKLMVYLNSYNLQMLYQKTGFLLERCCHNLMLSNAFFDFCRDRIGKSKRYLSVTRSLCTYIGDWGLMVPEHLLNYERND